MNRLILFLCFFVSFVFNVYGACYQTVNGSLQSGSFEPHVKTVLNVYENKVPNGVLFVIQKIDSFYFKVCDEAAQIKYFETNWIEGEYDHKNWKQVLSSSNKNEVKSLFKKTGLYKIKRQTDNWVVWRYSYPGRSAVDQLNSITIKEALNQFSKLSEKEKKQAIEQANDQSRLKRMSEDMAKKLVALEKNRNQLNESNKKGKTLAKNEETSYSHSEKVPKGDLKTWTEIITGMEFIWVPGGCYMMGDNRGGWKTKPVHKVCLDGFWIGKYEVTQAQWKKVMGGNPSKNKAGNNYPVEQVSWHDAKRFTDECYNITGYDFQLPTEAQWEYACNSGKVQDNKSVIRKYDNFAWYHKNSGGNTHAVGTKAPNDFGIHDMLGNVSEWCADRFNKEAYATHATKNPVNLFGWGRVARGSGYQEKYFLAPTTRMGFVPSLSSGNIGLRVVLASNVKTTIIPRHKIAVALNKPVGSTWVESKTSMEFVQVPGGCFNMGSDDFSKDETPVHKVCLDGYWIGKYEVTQSQWEQVMGTNPSYGEKGDDYPVQSVCWNDINEFIKKLNAETGDSFKLPTEAQWEYAARSGGKDQMFSGSNDVDDVGWYASYRLRNPHKVGAKKPNDLGIYDMSGNVAEYCEDLYRIDAFKNHKKNNPVNLVAGENRVVRGGGYGDSFEDLRTTARQPGFGSGDYNSVKVFL